MNYTSHFRRVCAESHPDLQLDLAFVRRFIYAPSLEESPYEEDHLHHRDDVRRRGFGSGVRAR
jgi:hypothetical protein